MKLFSHYFCFTAVGLLSACSTIPHQNTSLNGKHPRGGEVYRTCDLAVEALNETFSVVTKGGVEKTAYMDPKGPRCDVSANVIAVNKHGILRSVYDEKRETPESLSELEVALNKYLKNSKFPDKKIMIFIHGGLVPHRNAVSEAEIAAPWARRDGYFPIFLVWDSSLNSTYLDYLAYTTDGERNGLLFDDVDRNLQNDDEGGNDDGVIKRSILATTRVIGDLGTGIFKAPENYVVQFDNYWERNSNNDKSPYRLDPMDFPQILQAYSNETVHPSVDVRQVDLTTELHRTLTFPELGFLNSNDIELNTGTSWRSPSEYGYHALTPVRLVTTGFSEVGRNSWDNMVRRTRLAMSSPENLSQSLRTTKTAIDRVARKGEILAGPSLSGGQGADCQYVHDLASERRRQVYGGFTLSMELIDCVTKKHSSKGNAEITLAGHSMGAIVANEILWSYPDLNYDRVIYMAAAGSMRDFNRVALPTIRKNAYPAGTNEPQVEFNSLMLHPLAEARERIGKGVPPQGSLLEWIDEMFEGPRNFEEKTLGKYRNIRRLIYAYELEDQKFMNFRVFPVQESFLDDNRNEILPPNCDINHIPTQQLGRCHPLKHGEVNDYTFWRDSYLGR